MFRPERLVEFGDPHDFLLDVYVKHRNRPALVHPGQPEHDAGPVNDALGDLIRGIALDDPVAAPIALIGYGAKVSGIDQGANAVHGDVESVG